MDSNVQIVRSFKKSKPIAEIPEAPEFITRFLPSPSNSLLPISRNDQMGRHIQHLHFLAPHSTILAPLVDLRANPNSSNVPKRHAEAVIQDLGFDSVGDFLKILFYNPSHLSGESDP
ncbi:hypothetical protein K443DRAFT_4800 [Laccaria amethystina LaAM-08-1]|uniref:Uncharacterized protein n=1 Tax=Laccaria amethystina LaAM-08-1 TaxID=1095629 RepID=A0A0C9Y7X2_9AGAR|nr:hypothetical protein K443DRAFT_4800 [Laccaria amethystina LaAM-08-1]